MRISPLGLTIGTSVNSISSDSVIVPRPCKTGYPDVSPLTLQRPSRRDTFGVLLDARAADQLLVELALSDVGHGVE